MFGALYNALVNYRISADANWEKKWNDKQEKMETETLKTLNAPSFTQADGTLNKHARADWIMTHYKEFEKHNHKTEAEKRARDDAKLLMFVLVLVGSYVIFVIWMLYGDRLGAATGQALTWFGGFFKGHKAGVEAKLAELNDRIARIEEHLNMAPRGTSGRLGGLCTSNMSRTVDWRSSPEGTSLGLVKLNAELHLFLTSMSVRHIVVARCLTIIGVVGQSRH